MFCHAFYISNLNLVQVCHLWKKNKDWQLQLIFIIIKYLLMTCDAILAGLGIRRGGKPHTKRVFWVWHWTASDGEASVLKILGVRYPFIGIISLICHKTQQTKPLALLSDPLQPEWWEYLATSRHKMALDNLICR